MQEDKPKKEKEGKKKRRGKKAVSSTGQRRISADDLLSDAGNEPVEKDGETRASRSSQPVDESKKNGRKKFAIALVVILLIGGLAALTVLEWNWINDKVTSLWEDEKPVEAQEAHLFLTNPTTGQEYQDETINTVIGLTDDNGVIHGIVEIGWNRDGTINMYWISEGLVGKSQDGKDLSLSDALGGNIEHPGELRYIIERITGQTAHYVAVLPIKKALFLFEGLEFPPVEVFSDTQINNIYTQAREKVAAGRTIKDMDRVISYLLDEGGADEYYERVRRSQPYLEEAFSGIAGLSQEDLSAVLEEAPGTFTLSPSGSGEEGRNEYFASLLSAWSDGMVKGSRTVTLPDITILNGCGVVGAGSNLRNLLEGRGFMVADSGGNAKVVVDGQEYNDFSHQTSVLYYGTSDPLKKALAEYVAQLFGIPKVEFKESPDEITIVVGNDLAGKNSK